MTGGSNADNNIEIFYSDLNAAGMPSGANQKQITATTQTNLADTINILDIGRRMSRDGRYIAFDSYADLANENGGANYTSFALYLYDTMTGTFRRIGPRSDADATATTSGGDIAHYPGFTDTDANGTPQTLVLETRLNIIPAGTIAAVNDDGLNTNTVRPTQIYSYPLNIPAATATFTRLTKFPTPSFFLASTQPIPSNSLNRMSFTLALTEVGTGNFDSIQRSLLFSFADRNFDGYDASFKFRNGRKRNSGFKFACSDTFANCDTVATPTRQRRLLRRHRRLRRHRKLRLPFREFRPECWQLLIIRRHRIR